METVEEWIAALAQDPAVKVVEGKKDKQALESVGVTNVLCIAQVSFYKVVDKLSLEKEAILLTDFDFEGRKFFGKIRHECQRRGIKIKNRYREFLQQHTRMVHIESLPRFAMRLDVPNEE